MLFVEFRFFIFFAIVFSVHWALPGNTGRKAWLLLCSHIFYACFFLGDPPDANGNVDAVPLWSFYGKLSGGKPLPIGWWFPLVLIASTCMDYLVGIGIADARTEPRRKAWLLASLCMNLGVLGFFKYYNFFAGSAAGFLGWLGLHTSDWTLKIFLPFGISFYTFQSMSYSIDVYRRRLEPVRNFLDLAFFISFFPQLVAGPIVRAVTFLPQVRQKRLWANVNVRACVALFLIGFVKKACVSEAVAPVVDEFFAMPQRFDVFATWVGVLFYAVQIYCDFSGYTDMAIATARLLGYDLTINFNFPYLAPDIGDFWRRWHISLSTWLRDYLYIPLGGSRGSRGFIYRNLMVTMLLGGLWHGAAWSFVIWGGLHGVALIVHREWERLTQKAAPFVTNTMAVLAVPLTFYWVCLTWIFFRASPVLDAKTNEVKMTGLQVARTILRSFVLFEPNGKRTFGLTCLWLFAGLAVVHWLNSRHVFTIWCQRLPDWAFAALVGVGAALALFFVPTRYKPFIYFQF